MGWQRGGGVRRIQLGCWSCLEAEQPRQHGWSTFRRWAARSGFPAIQTSNAGAKLASGIELAGQCVPCDLRLSGPRGRDVAAAGAAASRTCRPCLRRGLLPDGCGGWRLRRVKRSTSGFQMRRGTASNEAGGSLFSRLHDHRLRSHERFQSQSRRTPT